jgi:hypothetical protein
MDPEDIEVHEGNPDAKVRLIKDEDAMKLRARRSERAMTEQLTLTIVYEKDPESEWITVSVPERSGCRQRLRPWREKRNWRGGRSGRAEERWGTRCVGRCSGAHRIQAEDGGQRALELSHRCRLRLADPSQQTATSHPANRARNRGALGIDPGLGT